MYLLPKIAWIFNSKPSGTIQEFNERVSEYQLRIKKEKACWQPHEVVVESAAVEIAFEAWITKGGLAPNETLLEDTNFFENKGNGEGGFFQAEIKALFKADNGKHFTALELLYKLDQQLKNKELGDHVFFEGLTADEKNSREITLFYVRCGS